ncbi:hypothetical protein AB0L35_10750 [Streptomyces sp. NPDC052309]|uniref:Secreted protein n=1 Tax=Streptomyces griseicoloratus TaxID=2752516 RepID=A0A926QQ16_9ACTN|nr:hypothetical protein [Streptomyces griseicoloratus]MBD0420324.1 hypothetical protein [Streptomyces griseicoloratus]
MRNWRGRTLMTAVAGASAAVLATAVPAHADSIVYNGYAEGGFISYGDKVWVEHYEGSYSYVEWYTNYGREGECSVGAATGGTTCNYDMRENSTITLRVCTMPAGVCSTWVSDDT